MGSFGRSATPRRQALARRSPDTDVKKAKTRTRNREQTRAALLEAAEVEFATHGFEGARVERIVKAAGCNMRMLYHYFQNKENLYLEVLEAVYRDIREKERKLDLTALTPVDALGKLVGFTWDHVRNNKVFIDITRNENLVGGRFIARSKAISEMSSPLIEQIADVIERGLDEGSFKHRADPLQLYISIVALSAHHIGNMHTLSAVFRTNLRSPKWLRERRRHVETMVFRMLGAPVDD